MIDSWTPDRTGWARFSDDLKLRFRLGRSLTGEPFDAIHRSRIAVFALLNPSKADAFVVDPTVRRAIAFARFWDAAGIEVVNIDAYRATDPDELYKLSWGRRGDDPDNDAQLLEACRGALIVIAGWGKHGALDHRGDVVRRMLAAHGVRLHHLGLNKDGSPKHPLYIQGGTKPQEWSV